MLFIRRKPSPDRPIRANLRKRQRRSAASVMAMIREHEARRAQIESSGTADRDDMDGGAGERDE